MSDSLSTLTSKLQAFMGDDGTIFTSAICTAAIRVALKTFNLHAPVYAGTLVDGVTDQLEYELSDEDSRAIAVMDVLLKDDDGENDISIPFDAYDEDERVWWRLRAPVTSSDTLIVRYTIPHTVNGLDSEVESTLPAWQDPILVVGAAAEAIMVRARARVETINLSKDQSDNYRELSVQLRTEFMRDLAAISRVKRPAVGEPDAAAWNDAWAKWG